VVRAYWAPHSRIEEWHVVDSLPAERPGAAGTLARMETAKKTKRAVEPKRIYQLRVSLEGCELSVWRRLWVADTLTLATLDRVIQAAMGWTNSHLHEFVIGSRSYGMPDDEWPGELPILDDRRHKLGAAIGTEIREFSYLYDFGDHWQHRVVVEQILLPNETNSWPMCQDGRNACPPEDVGGIGGYDEFLQKMQDPTDEEHNNMWRWHGGPFDPTSFDVNAANRAIRQLKA